MRTRFREKIRPIVSIVLRDIRYVHRHGLPVLALLSVLLLFLGIFGFTLAASTFRTVGTPSWTGSVLGEGGEPLRVRADADVYSGPAPLAVNFTANITGGNEPYNITWTLGDGNQSNEASVSQIYTDPGAHDVLLAVTDALGDEPTRSNIRVIVTEVGDGPLRAGIRANRTAGPAPLSIAFTATVVGGELPYTYLWEFGDDQNSTDPAPSHTFTDASQEYRVKLTVRDPGGNASVSNELYPVVEGGAESLPFTLLDVVFGYMVLVTMILVPVAFARNYNSEMKKGTVRVLTLYPIGVLGVTVAKLIYAGIVGFLFSFPVAVLPALNVGKPPGDILMIFLVTFLFSFFTVAVAAFVANAITRGTKRMYLKPTLLPYLFVIYAFLFTSKILTFATSFLLGEGASGVVRNAAPLIALSPYHQGGLLLSGMLGGATAPDVAVFLLPVALLILGGWLSKQLWPDVYERE